MIDEIEFEEERPLDFFYKALDESCESDSVFREGREYYKSGNDLVDEWGRTYD
jgi:hypothetical protein